MCNLYHPCDPTELSRWFGVALPGGAAQAPAVGPFGQGLFLRRAGTGLEAVPAQWGMIAPGARSARPGGRGGARILTNNARLETVAVRPTYRAAWAAGQRCLVPARAYQEPNWETGRNVWWTLRRADAQPWALAGLWSVWTDPDTGEWVPSYTLLTTCCDGHPLLGRLHRTDPSLPLDQQDRRTVIPLDPADWDTWLDGPDEAAHALLRPPPLDWYDTTPAREMDARLAALALPEQPGLFGRDAV